METLVDYKSYEKDILLNVFNEYSLMDSNNIYNIIEHMIYKEIEEYRENGSLKSKYTLRFGKKEGLYQEWFENGQKKLEYHYRDGKLDGLYQEWFENGQKNVEHNYQDGKLYGLYQSWYVNGQKNTEGNCKYGKWGLTVEYKPLKTLKRLKDNIICV